MRWHALDELGVGPDVGDLHLVSEGPQLGNLAQKGQTLGRGFNGPEADLPLTNLKLCARHCTY